jgi:DNA repair protein RadC
LLHQCGGLRALLAGRTPTRLPGLGEARVARLAAVLELARRCLREDLARTNALHDPADSAEFLHAQLATHTAEVFGCVFLDSAHRVIAFEELFHGTLDRAAVYPREVVRACLRHNAAAVILAHNHPSGVAEPSDADCHLTRELAMSLGLIGVRVLDHFIIGSANTVSLAQRGLL